MMTGTVEMEAIRRKTDRSWLSASCMSRRTSAGDAVVTRAMPSSPSGAVTTSKPSTDRVAASESRDGASSSMIRMVGCPSGGSTPSSTSRKATVMGGWWLSGTVYMP